MKEFAIVLLIDCACLFSLGSNKLCWIEITICFCLGELCIQDTGAESESIMLSITDTILLYVDTVLQFASSVLAIYASRYNKERDCPCSTTESHRCLHADCEAGNSSHTKMP